MTLTLRLMDPRLVLHKMLIRRRIEKLEHTSPTTIAGLVSRIEQEAMSTLSRKHQKFVDGPAGAHDAAVDELYQEALSSSLNQVSDDDLERMILFFEPAASHAQPLL